MGPSIEIHSQPRRALGTYHVNVSLCPKGWFFPSPSLLHIANSARARKTICLRISSPKAPPVNDDGSAADLPIALPPSILRQPSTPPPRLAVHVEPPPLSQTDGALMAEAHNCIVIEDTTAQDVPTPKCGATMTLVVEERATECGSKQTDKNSSYGLTGQ